MKYSGASTSQPYISRIILETLSDGKMKATVKVALKTHPGRLAGTGMMRTSIVKMADSNIIRKLLRNHESTNIELIENAKHSGRFGNLDLSIAEVKFLPKVLKEKEEGYRIANVEFVLDRGTSDLTFYVVCQHDDCDPRYARMRASRILQRKLYSNASVVAEDVFRAGALVKKSSAFVNNDPNPIQEKEKNFTIKSGNKNIWTGPVHYYSRNKPRVDGYVGHVALGLKNEQPKLEMVEFPNATIHDYRVLENISKVPFNCKLKEVKNDILTNKRNAYFSNLCITNDRDGLVRMFFAVDIGEVVKNNVKIPRFVASRTGRITFLDPDKAAYEDTINLSKFKNLSIKRERIDKFGNILQGGAERFTEKIVHSIQIGSKLADAGESLVTIKNENKNNIQLKALGSIREIDDLFLRNFYGKDENKNIRFFTATDLSMTNEKNGTYRYSVDLDVEDGSIVYLQELYRTLKLGLTAMQSYYSSRVDGTALAHRYFQNGLGPWTWAVDTLVKAIDSFNDGAVSSADLEEKLYILSSPTTSTLDSLSRVVKKYEEVTSQVEHIIKELPSKSTRDVENMKPNTVISGNRSFPQVINIQHTFTDLYEPNGGRETGYEYLSTPRTTKPGLLAVNSREYLKRTTQETLRFFNTNNSAQLNSLESAYLTPALVKIQNKTFNTFVVSPTGIPANNSEMANFNALINLVNFKKQDRLITETKQASNEEEKGKVKGCVSENLYSEQLSSFATHVKYGLSNVLAASSVVGRKKYENPVREKSENEEKDYTALMMPSNTNKKYKSEIPSRDLRDVHVNEEAPAKFNLSSIFAPLFYMKNLNIVKDLSGLAEKINTVAINRMPNQLKAMLKGNSNIATHNWYGATGKSSLKTLDNAAFHYLNTKNLVKVEVLLSFGGTVNSPNWVELRKEHIAEAVEMGKTTLLCRMIPYTNEALDFTRNELLDLNIFNQCFLMDATQEVTRRTQETKLNRKTEPMNKTAVLEKNDFLKLQSNFMRTNMMFGQIIKQNNIVKRAQTQEKRKTQTSDQQMQTTSMATPSTPSLTANMPTGGPSSQGTGGGTY